MFFSPGGKAHAINGFPTYPSRQLHIGLWLTTLQKASSPQVPGQGSQQILFMQARFEGHSEFATHSGRHSM